MTTRDEVCRQWRRVQGLPEDAAPRVWDCGDCGHENGALVVVCGRCAGPRRGAALRAAGETRESVLDRFRRDVWNAPDLGASMLAVGDALEDANGHDSETATGDDGATDCVSEAAAGDCDEVCDGGEDWQTGPLPKGGEGAVIEVDEVAVRDGRSRACRYRWDSDCMEWSSHGEPLDQIPSVWPGGSPCNDQHNFDYRIRRWRWVTRPVTDDGWRSVGKVGGVEVIRNPDREALDRVTKERDEARAELASVREQLRKRRDVGAEYNDAADALCEVVERANQHVQDAGRAAQPVDVVVATLLAELATVRADLEAFEALSGQWQDESIRLKAALEEEREARTRADEAADASVRKLAEAAAELGRERKAHAETRNERAEFRFWLHRASVALGAGGPQFYDGQTGDFLSDAPRRVVTAIATEHAGTVEANADLQSENASLVVERERVAAFVHDMAFDGALDARDGMARGWDVLERLSDLAQAGADALAAAAAEWEER